MKNGSLKESFYHAFVGIQTGITKEKNMIIHSLIMLLVIIFAIIFKISKVEWLICILCFGIVLSLELVNTAIEATVNICMPKIDERAKIAKDTAAGAVLLGAITSVIVGMIIFIPKIISLF